MGKALEIYYNLCDMDYRDYAENIDDDLAYIQNMIDDYGYAQALEILKEEMAA